MFLSSRVLDLVLFLYLSLRQHPQYNIAFSTPNISLISHDIRNQIKIHPLDIRQYTNKQDRVKVRLAIHSLEFLHARVPVLNLYVQGYDPGHSQERGRWLTVLKGGGLLIEHSGRF